MPSHVIAVSDLNGAKLSFNDNQELQVFPKGEYRVPKALLIELTVCHNTLPISFHETTQNAANTMAAMVPTVQLENILAIKQRRDKIQNVTPQLFASMVNNLRHRYLAYNIGVDSFSVVHGHTTQEGFPMTVLDNANGNLGGPSFEERQVPGRMLPESFEEGWVGSNVSTIENVWALCLDTIERVSGQPGLFTESEDEDLLMYAILGLENSISKKEQEHEDNLSWIGKKVSKKNGGVIVISMEGVLEVLIEDKILLKLIKDVLKTVAEISENFLEFQRVYVDSSLKVENTPVLKEECDVTLKPYEIFDILKQNPAHTGITLNAVMETFASLREDYVPKTSSDREIVNVLRAFVDESIRDSLMGRVIFTKEEIPKLSPKLKHYGLKSMRQLNSA